jgi:UDPglucose--hexose-1-phosphate uridylyltransferase
MNDATDITDTADINEHDADDAASHEMRAADDRADGVVNPSNVRIDPVLGTVVHVVGTRQKRPNLPSSGCPFCVGGIEAPEPYDVRSFPNRWPAMHGDRCEVVLYTPDHDATFPSLGVSGARKVVDLWADRTAALGGRPDVDYVLVFENRGAEVGATIAHPHGQIYAYDHVPARQARRLAGGWQPDKDPDERLVLTHGDWVVWVPYAPTFPLALEIAPLRHLADLPSMGDDDRDALAAVLVDVFARIDRLYDRPLPYMMWLNQRPTVAEGFEDAWFNIEIVSPWRSAGVQRFIAAAEIASDEFFNPVIPEDVAARLRELG